LGKFKAKKEGKIEINGSSSEISRFKREIEMLNFHFLGKESLEIEVNTKFIKRIKNEFEKIMIVKLFTQSNCNLFSSTDLTRI
jgi:hypothetical protein